MAVKAGYKQTEVGVIPEDWTVQKLGETYRYQNGTALETLYNSHEGFRVISIGNFSSSGKYVDNSTFISPHHIEKIKDYILKKDDLTIILNDKTPAGVIIGRALLIQKDNTFVFNQRTMRLSPKVQIHSPYVYFVINSDFVHDQMKSLAKTGTQIYLNTGDITEFEIPTPPTLAEQEAIAAALSDADTLIAALEGLIAKKRQIKQGAMQELLSVESGEWRVKSLGDVLTLRYGKSQKGIVVEDGKYPILATSGEVGRTNEYLYDKPSVIIGRKGTIDEPQYIDTPFWTIDTAYYSEISKQANPKFLFYLLSTIEWYSYNEASGVPSLNAKTVESIEVSIPELPEQTAIAEILSDMDAEIEMLAAKLSKARQVKQGMMSQLLTGRVRLVNSGELIVNSEKREREK